MKKPIYLDYHATTPLDPQVLEVVQAAEREIFGNPSSMDHAFGKRASERVAYARTQVAALIGCDPEEIVFTSGATEANNLAIKGVAEIYSEKGKHIITQVTEHKSVLEVCRALEKKGFEVTYLPVDGEGRIRVQDLKEAIRKETILISMMWANNEIGTIQPIQEIGKIAKEHNIFFHVDGAQALGKVPVRVKECGIDLFSCSAHKCYGPKGVGALFVRKKHPRVRLTPQIHGGGQEGGLRSGTLHVSGIVGFGKACEIVLNVGAQEIARIQALRDRLWMGIKRGLSEVYLNGPESDKLAHNLSCSFPELDGELLLKYLNETLAVSAGSACIRKNAEPSYVLKAIGIPEQRIHTSIRFGVGRFNTSEEIDFAIQKVIEGVLKFRQESPFKMRSQLTG